MTVLNLFCRTTQGYNQKGAVQKRWLFKQGCVNNKGLKVFCEQWNQLFKESYETAFSFATIKVYGFACSVIAIHRNLALVWKNPDSGTRKKCAY